ncbi:MAG: multicopper oxidase domain-containing protein [Clostridiaceae bacterium]|nr:multicopper oxidase domain-containing protein [Clostridiaceae bacterium]
MKLKPFVDPLPIPRILKPKERTKDKTYYEVTMRQIQHQFHSKLPPTTCWGYEGQIPGPTIEVEEGENVHILWKNELPDKHLLPVDHTLHGSHEGMPEVRTVVHLHGANVDPESDGHPDAWFTNGFAKCGPRFTQKVYKYPNNQPATTLWYHDHALGITRLNVYAGLAGMYIIRNEQERALNLPSGIYEIPLVIQDKTFNEDGSLFYPSNVENPPPEYPPVSITPGFAGDTIIVNGKAWPYLEVEQRKYRFRILNGSNERFYRMRLDSGQEFIQIGSDGGLLPRPVRLEEIVIGPAERADVIIDFSNQPAGTSIILTNTARTPFDFGQEPNPLTDGRIMQFRVIPRTSEDTSSIPQFLTNIKRFDECDIVRTRDITLDVGTDKYTRLLFLLNNHDFIDGVTEDPAAGDIECWRIINAGLGVHPIHIHQVQFQVLDRTPFDTAVYNQTGRIRFTGEPELPPANERGWKDTVQAYPGQITRVAMRFGPYTGRYVYHCHILEHEDHDMMRPFDVVERKCIPVDSCCKK